MIFKIENIIEQLSIFAKYTFIDNKMLEEQSICCFVYIRQLTSNLIYILQVDVLTTYTFFHSKFLAK